MAVLVSVETVLLVLLVVLVAGLLRSHAELLRRIGPGEGPPGSPAAPQPGYPAVPPPSSSEARRGGELAAAPLAGMTPDGDALTLSFERPSSRPTLLAFLSSGCTTCAGFWETLPERRLPGVQTVIVTRGAEREQPARLRALAPESVPVVMSSAAWEDYRVPGAPYFVLVDGEILGEGVATGWTALSSLVRDALADRQLVVQRGEADGVSTPGDGGTRRARAVDDTLAAAGIEAGHPSLYPGRAPVR